MGRRKNELECSIESYYLDNKTKSIISSVGGRSNSQNLRQMARDYEKHKRMKNEQKNLQRVFKKEVKKLGRA